MNCASIKESENPLTENLTVSEDFETNKEIEAIDMEKYNEMVILQQIEDVEKKRKEVETDANKRVQEYNAIAKGLKDRYAAFLEKTNTKNGWDDFKNHWYWKSYFENLNKTSYSEEDNQRDNLNPANYYPVELSKDYQQIGNFNGASDEPAPYVDEDRVYLSSSGEYVYDYVQNKIFPKDKKMVYDENTVDGVKEKIKELQNQPLQLTNSQQEKVSNLVFKLKELKNNVNINPESTPRPTKIKEDFESVDPTLVEIYQKTLPPNEYNIKPKPVKRNLLLNYIYCLIFVLFLYLVFKTS
jgi:hypothetical protein